jgi:hypothetical protein
MGLRRGEPSRRERVQYLALALQRVLKPTAERRPIIGERDRAKIEIIAFGIDATANGNMREALAAIGGVEPIIETRPDGAKMHRAWVVNPLSERELADLENIARDEADEEAPA